MSQGERDDVGTADEYWSQSPRPSCLYHRHWDGRGLALVTLWASSRGKGVCGQVKNLYKRHKDRT